MRVKFFGANRQSKPNLGKIKGPTGFANSISEVVPASYESSRSTPTTWDLTTFNYLGGRSNPKSIGGSEGDIIFGEKDIVTKEWVAEVEPGVLVTFVYFPFGANHLKKVHFCPEVITELQAQIWWAENYERILDLYKVQRYSDQALYNSPPANDRQRGHYPFEQLAQSGGHHFHARSSMEPSMTTTTYFWEQHSISNDYEIEAEWMEQDENGIYIKIGRF
ncbi:hypothetical protein RIF29_33168 [Crotalaria pallida]|uniref:BRX domain-containing protein n=1 Tax=Crotalaria pallida TaxID=3830 RepID=A0AAN9E9Q8_CROPI